MHRLFKWLRSAALGIALVLAIALVAGGGALLWVAFGELAAPVPQAVPSSDAEALKRYFAPDVALTNVQWELFATPEAPSRLEVPGPTDFVTLVVVGRAVDSAALDGLVPLATTGPAFAVRNAPRPWLPAWAQAAIKHVAEAGHLPGSTRCKALAVPGVVSGTLRDGFVCTNNGVVMYLITLATPSG